MTLEAKFVKGVISRRTPAAEAHALAMDFAAAAVSELRRFEDKYFSENAKAREEFDIHGDVPDRPPQSEVERCLASIYLTMLSQRNLLGL